MSLKNLFNKRLLFVSGKGGVGKTTVSVLLALLGAKLKKKALLVEMNAAGRIAPVFKCDSIGHDEVALAPYLSGINLLPKRCFEEYVLSQVRFKKIYELFFDNKYVTNFIRAVPGLNELLMLGKIYDLEKRFKSRVMGKKEYDLIIVDAPATGHGLSALEVPKVVMDAVTVGPLHTHAKHILELLANKEKTAFCMVTLAEEMPVCEAKEYSRAIKYRTEMGFGPLFVNAIMEKPEKLKAMGSLKNDLIIFKDYYDLANKRHQLNATYKKEIEHLFGGFSKVFLPYQFKGVSEQKDFNKLVQQLIGDVRD